MRSTIFGVVCLVLVSAVSCQYNLSPFVIKAREVVVSNHLKSQLILDRRFFKYFDHVRNAATKAFAPIQAAEDDFLDAWSSIGPLLPEYSTIGSFNQTVLSALSMTTDYGVNTVLSYAAMGMYGGLSTPAQMMDSIFSSMMSSLIMVATTNTYPGSLYAPKSDACIQETFDKAKSIYDRVVNASLDQATAATANVTQVQKEVTLLSNTFKQLLTIMTNQLRSCGQDYGCLEYWVNAYTSGDRSWLLQNVGIPYQQFSIRMSSISMLFPGYGSGNPDVTMEFYDLTNLCEPFVY